MSGEHWYYCKQGQLYYHWENDGWSYMRSKQESDEKRECNHQCSTCKEELLVSKGTGTNDHQS